MGGLVASSRASSLPRGIRVVHTFVFCADQMWERACSGRRSDDSGLSGGLLLPAIRRRMITVPPFNPARAVNGVVFCPERRAGLEVVHDKGAGVERRLAMGTGGTDKTNATTRESINGNVSVRHCRVTSGLIVNAKSRGTFVSNRSQASAADSIHCGRCPSTRSSSAPSSSRRASPVSHAGHESATFARPANR